MDGVEDIIITMENEEIDKRKASPNALDADDIPHLKRIHSLSWSDYGDSDSEYDFEYFGRKPHVKVEKTIFEYFFQDEKFVEVLAEKLERNTQHKELIGRIMDFLRNAYVEGVQSNWVQIFDESVKILFSCPAFIQACVDTYSVNLDDLFDDCDLLAVTINIYKDEKQPSERMKSLMDDSYFQHVLQDEMGSFPISRVVLSVLFGYWSDDALYTKVYSAVNYFHEDDESFRVEKVVGVCVQASVEGLKDSLRSRYPEDEANLMCEQIDSKMYEYDYRLPREEKGDDYFYMP